MATVIANPMPSVITEDLGTCAERGLCLLLNTPFEKKFRYSMEEAERLSRRFAALGPRLAGYRHTGAKDKLYDFKAGEGGLSVKTTKDGSYKVCPQIVGQTTRKRWCEAFGIPVDSTGADIKAHILASLPTLMPIYEHNTFHCPVLFYDKKEDACLYIRRTEVEIPWATAGLTWSRGGAGQEAWNESNTLYGASGKAIGEFQIHAHRNCVKFRFNLKNLLAEYPTAFAVETIAAPQ